MCNLQPQVAAKPGEVVGQLRGDLDEFFRALGTVMTAHELLQLWGMDL